jgi:Transmembrane family 220, helix
MKVLSIILGLMFLAFSFVQINDPDPLVWILIYGSMAVVCFMAAFRYYVRPLMIVQAIAYLVYAATDIPSITTWLKSPDKAMLLDDFAKMHNVYIEESREFLGLVICLLVLVLYWIKSSPAKAR